MDRTYALAYRQLYERHWWWRAREDLILSELDDWRPGQGWGPILDVGCGDGLFFEKLERLGPVEGIEMDPTGIRPDGPWASRIRLGPFDSSFEPGKKYALVLMLDVLEHLPDAVMALRRAVELLQPEGIVLLTVPAFPILWTSHDELNHHYARYSRSSLTALARAAGACLLDSRYFFVWAAPVKLAVRARELLFGATPATPSIPPDWLNRTLYRVSRLEQRILRRVPIPFGASLLAILRRAEEAR
ncbi:MAG TPA: class I SAM-dependent methyltransferase [Thermoanaerobaculia bacterium]|nr:class I SAM-dependent methyltransferase [Thermoanaerobaculia bacterium]